MVSFSGSSGLGSWGEQLAAEYLKKQGFILHNYNYRCCYGEIDLIGQEGSVWCFVEVKTRKSSAFGYGYEAVISAKRKHIIRVAQYFLNQMKLYDVPARFDVVSIDFINPKEYRIQLIRNAFYTS